MFDKSCKLRKQKILAISFLIAFGSGFMIASLFSLTECQFKAELSTLLPNVNELLPNVLTVEPRKEAAVADENDGSDIRCRVPKLDPWDPSIEQWIKHPGPVQCSQVQPYMTFMDDEGFLQLNETEVANMRSENLQFNCSYWTFDRNTGSDDESIWYDAEMLLVNRTQLSKDNVEVVCKYENGTEFYWNVYAYPVKREDLTFAKPTEDQLNVLFFIVDSVSNSAFQRNLPMSYNYSKNAMAVTFFNGG